MSPPRQRRSNKAAWVAALAVGALAGGLLGWASVRVSRAVLSSANAPGSSRVAATNAVPGFDHVFIVLEENHPFSSIIGNTQAPYLNSLAARYGLALSYNAITHPSLPNYLALTGGSTFGITSDCDPSSCPVNAVNIADRIEGSQRTWKAYMEDMPSPCTTSDAGNYVVRHDPFVYFNDISTNTSRCVGDVVPFSTLASDLTAASTTPNYAFITPNVCNDMHDCSVGTGDTWLKNNLPAIFNSPAWTTQNSVLFVTWDEGDSSSNQVATLVISPSVPPGTQSRAAYDHYSLLRTVEDAWNLPSLTANDGAASAMSDFFPGLLRVTTVPALAAQILVNGVPSDSRGLNWLKLAPGSYTVSFTHIEGYTEPAPQTVSVSAGQTTTVNGSFSQTGWLRVITNPAVAGTILVDGIPRDDWGMWTDLLVGNHQVCFGPVANMSPPACQNAAVTAGNTTTVTGTYTANPGAPAPGGGMLRVVTSPAVASQILVDGVPADTWGLNWVHLPVGNHTVAFTHVEGFTEPTVQTVTISDGATTTVTATFVQRGELHVFTSPALAGTISIDGIARDDWGVFTDLPAGSHQICFGAVAGHTAPACQTINLTTAGAIVTGTYT